MSEFEDKVAYDIRGELKHSKIVDIYYDDKADRYRVKLSGGTINWYGLFPTAENARLFHNKIVRLS